MYIETSAPRVTNDKARLESASLVLNKDYCLQFWYHMYGPHINQLNIYFKVQTKQRIIRYCGKLGEFYKHGYFTNTELSIC